MTVKTLLSRLITREFNSPTNSLGFLRALSLGCPPPSVQRHHLRMRAESCAVTAGLNKDTVKWTVKTLSSHLIT
eukprot:1683407-Pyramimonas_sp.AAC.2